MSIETAFAQAREAALLASADLVLALGRVAIFTALPTKEPLPYVWAGEVQILDDSDDCLDGFEIVSTTHVWAKPDTLEVTTAATIAGLVRTVLKAELAIAGYVTQEALFEDSRTLTDPDGSTHVTITHRYLVEASA